MEPISWTVSAIGQALIGQLLVPQEDGAQLTDKPIRLNTLVAWRQADKEVNRRGIAKILRVVADRYTHTNSNRIPSDYNLDRVIGRASQSLMSLESLTMTHVQESYLDPVHLANILETAAPDSDEHFNAEEAELYNHIMLESCKHLIDYFSRRPEFQARTLVEQSQRLGTLLDRTPDSNLLHRDFERRYKGGLVRLSDRVKLFGLGLPSSQQSYKLSTAYVSLSVSEDSLSTGEHSRTSTTSMSSSIGLDDVLASNKRIILEGPAGAGKTTLLTHLALHICKGDLPSQLASWGEAVPFLLRLRSFYRNGQLMLPQPQGFVSATIPPISLEPDGWTDSLLDEGRGVVLIDGIDEVPMALRQQVLNWLEQLVNYYPNSHFLATSRPIALDAGQNEFLKSLNFTPARIEPMTPAQVDSFIDRWHDAAGEATQAEGSLKDRAAALKAALLRRRVLSRLASNPLMCAMLCALNRNHNSSLPLGRIALYRAALAMLLGRRDLERMIPVGEIQLTEDQAQVLLSQIALWMTLNGRRTISKDEALRSMQEVLPRLRVDYGVSDVPQPEKVLRYLRERSGMLQEPEVDSLEFRHSSFQDYFAASELIRRGYVQHIIRNADDPLYHDIVIMAVGQTQGDANRQYEVLGGLIARARNATNRLLLTSHPASADIRLSRSLWLLAAASIADVELVAPDLEQQILAQTKELLPPADVDEAESVAGAGEFVIDLLMGIAMRNDLASQQICGIVRVASLMEGDSAFTLLKMFRDHPNQSVQAQIVDGWFRSRSPERYVEEILRYGPLDSVEVRVTDPSFIKLLPRVTGLKRLDIACSTQGVDLSSLALLTELVSLDISDTDITDVCVLSPLKKLETLALKSTRIWDLSPLADFRELRAVNLAKTPTMSLEWASRLRNLTALDISDTLVNDLGAINSLSKMETLDASGSLILNIEAVQHFAHLRFLYIERTKVADLSPVVSLTELRRISASRTAVSDLQPLAGLRKLQTVDIGQTPVSSLSPLAGAFDLIALSLPEAPVRDLTPLSQLSRLQYLDLTFTWVTDLAPLAESRALRSLYARGTGISDLGPLAELTSLRELNLQGTAVEDVSPLRRVTSLRRLGLMGTAVSDVRPLSGLRALRFLDLVGTAVKDVSALKQLEQLSIET